MDDRTLTLFIAVATHGNFAAVARQFDMDPSSVSRVIAGLEDELGTRLFQRTTRKVTLTEAGSLFAGKVEPVLRELEQVREDLHSLNAAPRGKIRFTTAVSFGHMRIMPILPEFLERYPEIDLHLEFADRNVDLVAENIDLALRLAPAIESDVIASRLTHFRYLVCASPQYIARHGRPDVPTDLSHHRGVCFDLPGFRDRWLFRDKSGTVEPVSISPRLTVRGAMSLYEAALSGIGPALIPDWLVGDDIANGKLVDLFPDHEVGANGFGTGAWLIYPSRNFLPRKTRVLIDYLREKLAGPPAGTKV